MGWPCTAVELARILGAAQTPALERAPAFDSVSTDTRTLRLGQAFFALSGLNFDGNQFVPEALAKGAAVAVASKSFDGPCLVVEHPLSALQQFAAHHRRQHRIPLLAITGSCGKTSAKDFIAALLATKYQVLKTQGNLNNDIGCPMTLLNILADTDIAIIEMGANHAGEIAQLCTWAAPTEAAVTMVGPAHLEGFGSVERVAAAKAEIIEALPPDGCFYVNLGDPWCRNMAESYSGKKIGFGPGGEVALRSCAFNDAGEMLLDIEPIGALRLPLPLRAQAVNVLLAVAVGLRHGIKEFEAPLRSACVASTRFRLERVGPLEILDDSYNANPSSMRAAIEALAERPGAKRRFAVLGEMLELGESAPALHREIGEAAAWFGIDRLYVRGPHAYDMIAGAQDAGIPFAQCVEDPQTLAEALHAEAQPGDVLLIKGSRGMRMERVLEALRHLYLLA